MFKWNSKRLSNHKVILPCVYGDAGYRVNNKFICLNREYARRYYMVILDIHGGDQVPIVYVHLISGMTYPGRSAGIEKPVYGHGDTG